MTSGGYHIVRRVREGLVLRSQPHFFTSPGLGEAGDRT